MVLKRETVRHTRETGQDETRRGAGHCSSFPDVSLTSVSSVPFILETLLDAHRDGRNTGNI